MVALTSDHHFIGTRHHLNSFRIDALLLFLLLGTFATVRLLRLHFYSEPILIQLHRLSSLQCDILSWDYLTQRVLALLGLLECCHVDTLRWSILIISGAPARHWNVRDRRVFTIALILEHKHIIVLVALMRGLSTLCLLHKASIVVAVRGIRERTVILLLIHRLQLLFLLYKCLLAGFLFCFGPQALLLHLAPSLRPLLLQLLLEGGLLLVEVLFERGEHRLVLNRVLVDVLHVFGRVVFHVPVVSAA